MSEKQNHIICSHSVELEFYDRKENLFIQNTIADLVKHRLLPAMEALFDELTSSGKKIKIDALELNLAEIQNAAWEDEFVNQSIYGLRQKLNEIVAFSSAKEVYEVSYKDDKANINGIPAIDDCINNFDFFLQSGLLPWNLNSVTASDLLNTILDVHRSGKLTLARKENLLRSVFYSADSFERFVLQFDHEKLAYFFENILGVPQPSALVDSYKRLISPAKPQGRMPEHRQKLLAWIFALFEFQASNKAVTVMPPASEVINRIKKDLPASSLDAIAAAYPEKKFLKQMFSKENVSPKTQTDAERAKQFEQAPDHPQTIKTKSEDRMEYFIDNAGLVILSPFLQQLFNNLKFSRKKQFRSEGDQVRAILLSQYLVTGKIKIAEHELPVNKIICGYPLEKTLPCEFEPTEDEVKQCNELFQSVLEYWKELKTTSREALRNTYIIRNGKLINKNDYWLLQVEYKAYDVMLQFLPWSIGIIFLPWMKKRLMVEWHA